MDAQTTRFAVGRRLLALSCSDRHLARMTDPDPITRLNAALEGRYRIERELGEGRLCWTGGAGYPFCLMNS